MRLLHQILSGTSIAFIFTGAMCEKNPATADDDCGRRENEFLEGIVELSPSGTKNYYRETSKNINNNCHAQFKVIVRHADPIRAEKDTTEPPVRVEFGTDFIFGSGFPVSKRLER